MIELVGENASSEINDGKLLIKLRNEVVVEAGDGEVENDAILVDEVGEVVIVVEVELDEEDGVIAWDEELVEGDVVVEAGDGEVEKDAMLVDEVGEVVIVVEVELDEEDGVVEKSGVVAWDEELVEGDVVVEGIEAVKGDVVVEKIEVVEGDVVVEVNVVNVVVEESKVVERYEENVVGEKSEGDEVIIVFGFRPLFFGTEGSSELMFYLSYVNKNQIMSE